MVDHMQFEVFESELPFIVQKACELSKPQGMGLIHYEPGPLSDEDAAAIVYTQGRQANRILTRLREGPCLQVGCVSRRRQNIHPIPVAQP